MTEKLVQAIERYQGDFGLGLAPEQIEKLAGYHRLVQKHNPLLHLVAPCDEEEFAVRHLLESLTLLEFLPENAELADVGTGAGLPSIPCLLVRRDLRGVLIESKEKKAAFLREVLTVCGLADRTLIINKQFEEISSPRYQFVACRALDKFTRKLPKLLKWAGTSRKLFFGGPALRDELAQNGLAVAEKLMPHSTQRYLFISE